MSISSESVNTWTQPALFGRSACAVSLVALCDPDDETVVFVVESREAPGQRLRGLWSSSPVPLDRHLEALHEAHKAFVELLYDASGPFA